MAQYDIATFGSKLEFDTTNGTFNRVIKLTDTRFIVSWRRTNYELQCFELNKSTGEITALSSPYEIGITATNNSSLVRIDDTHFVFFYQGNGLDGYAFPFQVNSSTGAITSWNTELEFDTDYCEGNSALYLTSDSTYAYIFNSWSGDNSSSPNGLSRVFKVNKSTGEITTASNEYEFETSSSLVAISAELISSSKVLVTYRYNASSFKAKIISLSQNGSTWTLSSGGNVFGTGYDKFPGSGGLSLISSNPLVAVASFYDANTGSPVPYSSIINLSINNSTWAITQLGSIASLYKGALTTSRSTKIIKVDDTHFTIFFTGEGSDGYVRTYELNSSNGALTQLCQLEFDTDMGIYLDAVDMGDSIYVCAWGGTTDDGMVQSFKIELTKPTNTQINIGDTWKEVESIKINIGDSWKDVESAQINIGDTWKTIY